MSRETCYRCFWPKALCWCEQIVPIATATRFVLLTHPKEARKEKAGTGRLTHLCLPNSEIVVGTSFERDVRVQALCDDPSNHVVLLYPGEAAVNLSAGDAVETLPRAKQLVVLLLDATWSCARKMLRLSPNLQRLPRVMFTPSGPSRYVIKQQPIEGCLSTLESVHEVLSALRAAGRETYPHADQLLAIFDRMQRYQIACAQDPDRGGYRRSGYREPGDRKPMSARSVQRRSNFFRVGGGPGAVDAAPE